METVIVASDTIDGDARWMKWICFDSIYDYRDTQCGACGVMPGGRKQSSLPKINVCWNTI